MCAIISTLPTLDPDHGCAESKGIVTLILHLSKSWTLDSHDLLQAEKHDELTLRNHHQHSVGSTSLPKVHYSVKGNEKGDGFNNHQKKFDKFKKGKCNN
jgi:hypothetical protein